MIHRTQKGQYSAGEAIGILLLESPVPFIPGDVANATTYPFPVRFQEVEGFTVERALAGDPTIYDHLLAAARSLVRQGVRAVTGDCGFMGFHQPRLAEELGVPVFLSSLIQIPFICRIIGPQAKVGVLTASGQGLNDRLLAAVGAGDPSRLVIRGLEEEPAFRDFALDESGSLDQEAVQKEVVGAAREITAGDPTVRAILLECSLLPPYGAAVQEAVGLPVFDYVTMINHVFSAVVKQPFQGFV